MFTALNLGGQIEATAVLVCAGDDHLLHLARLLQKLHHRLSLQLGRVLRFASNRHADCIYDQ